MNFEKVECSIWRTPWLCMVYMTGILEQLIDTVQRMHNHITWNEKLLMDKSVHDISGTCIRTELVIMLLIQYYF